MNNLLKLADDRQLTLREPAGNNFVVGPQGNQRCYFNATVNVVPVTGLKSCGTVNNVTKIQHIK